MTLKGSEREIAKNLGISRATLRHKVAKGEIKIERKRGRAGDFYTKPIDPDLSLTIETAIKQNPDGLMQDEIAKVFRTTKQNISAMEYRAIRKLQESVGKELFEQWLEIISAKESRSTSPTLYSEI